MKRLAKLAVERPVTVFMTSLIVIGFGLMGLTKLRLNLYPDVSFPTITVYTTYEGVAPEDMETLITRPIEEAVGSISGIQRVRSLSSQGASVVKLYFDWGTDLYQAESDVRKKLDFVRRTVPDDAEQPIVFSYDPNQEPIVVLTLTSDVRSSRELRTLATQQLEQRIERIPGIASAETAGGLERQINISISNQAMRAYGVDLQTVAQKLQQENVQVPAGELIEGRTIYSLRTIGEFQNVEQIANTIITVRDGQPILLKDVAEVEDGVGQPIGGVHVDGQDGVIINAYRQSDANIVTAAESLVGSMETLKNVLPGDVNLRVLTDKSEFINQSIQNLVLTGIQAVILVVIILLFFLRSSRSALIIAVSIPISIISTFSIMDAAELSLNIISLSGLTLAVGMVVDDAVVVLENIFRFREDGYNGKDSAVFGAQEVAVPVVISTLTTLVVFLPVLFVPGIAGFLFRDLALTLSFALSVSSLVALSLIPMMSSQLFSEREESDEPDAFQRLHVWSENELWKKIVAALPLLIMGLGKLIAQVTRAVFQGIGHYMEPRLSGMLDRLDAAYRSALDRSLKRSGWVLSIAFILLAASVPLFYQLGGEFFPRVDENAFTLSVEREPGVSLFELERTIEQVESIIEREVPEARLIVSEYGDKTGVEGAENPGGYNSRIRVELTPSSDRDRSQFEITSEVLDALHTVPGASIKEVRQDPLSPDGQNGLIVQIYGYEPQQRQKLAHAVDARLNDINGIVNVFSTANQGRPELRVIMDRERISRLGMTTSQVANSLSSAVKGNLATTYIDQGVEFEVLVQLDPRDKAETTSLDQLQVQTPEGDWVPLRNLARIIRYEGPTNILRINQERVSEVQADLAGLDLQQASERAQASLDQMQWPEGYRYELGGTAEEQAQSFYYLMIAFAIAGVLTYMVMASQFESLVEPFIIIFTIPLALTGVLLILWLTSTPVSVTSMVGLVLLSGIVVNNGIVMIDYIKILQARGNDRHDAIVTGASRRLRPILMTAFTTILSMVPLALELGSGSETWSPMARTVIGGLTASTLLMLFVVPSMYKMINQLVETLGFDAIHKLDPLAEDASSGTARAIPEADPSASSQESNS
jgi:HAE1 family hydrophobic/amphiphilic exporter-1